MSHSSWVHLIEGTLPESGLHHPGNESVTLTYRIPGTARARVTFHSDAEDSARGQARRHLQRVRERFRVRGVRVRVHPEAA